MIDIFSLAESCIAATAVEEKLARSAEAATLIAADLFATTASSEPRPIVWTVSLEQSEALCS